MATASDIKNYRGPMNREAQKMLGKFLDDRGWTLTYANDPVDGEMIVVLDWSQVFGLVTDLLPDEDWELTANQKVAEGII